MPDTEAPLTAAATGWLYQPLESGGRARTTETAGPEPSYSNCVLVALAILPALSTQLPPTVAVLLSGPEYVLGVQETIPEKDFPLTVAVTGWVYQPLKSGGRDGATDADGLDVSTFSAWLTVVGPDGPVIVHEIVVMVSST